jgi:hypothetical protein
VLAAGACPGLGGAATAPKAVSKSFHPTFSFLFIFLFRQDFGGRRKIKRKSEEKDYEGDNDFDAALRLLPAERESALHSGAERSPRPTYAM